MNWTKEEEIFLIDIYPKGELTAKEIGQLLNGRSPRAIWGKARKLGLTYAQDKIRKLEMVTTFDQWNISQYVVNEMMEERRKEQGK